jgi:predicted nucleotidyltransferase
LWKQVDCNNGGQCWQAEDGDTWESFSRATGYSEEGLKRFFVGETITSGQVFDVGEFEAWTRSLDNKFLGEMLRHRPPEFEPVAGGGLRNVSKAAPAAGRLLSRLARWFGFGKTVASAARNIGGITAEEAARLRALLEKIPGAAQVRAFGSRTTGAFTKASDLDIVVFGNVDKANPNTVRAVIEAQQYAESIGIGMGRGYRSLDINVYKSVEEMNKAFRSNPSFDASRGVPKLVTIE